MDNDFKQWAIPWIKAIILVTILVLMVYGIGKLMDFDKAEFATAIGINGLLYGAYSYIKHNEL